MDIEPLLESIGLTKSEAKTYLALLELGSSTTGHIVDKAKVASSKIYEILDKLISKGLVNYITKGKIKHFEAAQPERILDYLKEKEHAIKKEQEKITQALPELKLKTEISKHKQEAKIYRGMKGLHTAFYEALDMLETGEDACAYGIPERSKAVNRFFTKFNRTCIEQGHQLQTIFDETARLEKHTLTQKEFGLDIKFMPKSVKTPA